MSAHSKILLMETCQTKVKDNNINRTSIKFKNQSTIHNSISLERIRANQGHTLKVDVELKEVEPPEFLYHGTVYKFLNAIQREGLMKMKRQHVHLSIDEETAINVGSRRGRPNILIIRSGQMHRDGIPFYLSENKVWLTDSVLPNYIDFK